MVATILRATQFYDLILTGAEQAAKLPVPVPAGFRVQPIDPDEVAARLVQLALGAPAQSTEAATGRRTWQEFLERRLKPIG